MNLEHQGFEPHHNLPLSKESAPDVSAEEKEYLQFADMTMPERMALKRLGDIAVQFEKPQEFEAFIQEKFQDHVNIIRVLQEMYKLDSKTAKGAVGYYLLGAEDKAVLDILKDRLKPKEEVHIQELHDFTPVVRGGKSIEKLIEMNLH